MASGGRRHDRALLDALEAYSPEMFAAAVWRVTLQGRDPLRGSASGGRWSPPGEFEVLYTSLSKGGALAEIGYRLSLEPVWPSRMSHDLHRIDAKTGRSLCFADLNSLQPLGVDAARYTTFNYAVTQSIAAAAHFLEFDGLIVPSARAPLLNLVIFMDRLDPIEALQVQDSTPVDWQVWRTQR